MNDILKSKRFWVAVISGVIGILVVLIPDLEQYSSTIIESLTVIAGLLIGGYSIQDAIVSYKSGTSKYDSKREQDQ